MGDGDEPGGAQKFVGFEVGCAIRLYRKLAGGSGVLFEIREKGEAVVAALCVHRDAGLVNRSDERVPAEGGPAEKVAGWVAVLGGDSDAVVSGVPFLGGGRKEAQGVAEFPLQGGDKLYVCLGRWPECARLRNLQRVEALRTLGTVQSNRKGEVRGIIHDVPREVRWGK